MSQSNRFYSNNRQQQGNKKATRYIENTGVITKVLNEGYLPIQHNSLPVPFKSFEVETGAGKRYVVQIRGRQAFNNDFKLGFTIQYGGVFIFGREIQGAWHGGYFLASEVRVTKKEVDSYVKTLLVAQARMEAEQQAQEQPELPVQE